MPIEDWNKDDKGVILRPVAGYEVAIFRHTVVGLRLITADRLGSAGAPAISVQVGCSPEHARALARSLTEAADRADTETSR